MVALITPTQLASRLQSDVDTSSAQDACDKASGLVRAVAQQQFDFVSQEVAVLSGGDRVLKLPQRPIIVDTGPNLLTVVEVGQFGGLDFICIEDRDYSRIGNELTRGYAWYWNNTVRLMGWPRMRPLGVWAPKVRVTYSHGYTTVPDDVQSIVLDVAAILFDNPTGLRSVHIDDYTETKASEVLGTAMVQSIRDKLAITGRRRRAFSIRTS